MSMELEMSTEEGILYARLSGPFSLPEAKRTFVDIVKEAVRNKTSKVFVDGRDVKGEPEFMERFYYGDFAAATVRSNQVEGWSSPRFAFVLKEPTLDPDRFGETVAVNRGMNVRVFDNVEQARSRLDIAQPEKPPQG